MQYAKPNTNVEDNSADGKLHSFLNIAQLFADVKS